ncbi:MAG TPA: hypothetical protein VHI54_03000 [Actinomycetota bacterium]|nr:hypothetical protein [Actinomycetota bacterium]
MSAEQERAIERFKDAEKLIRRSEKALTEIKVAQGLSDEHASVLAALRIYLKGDPGKSLEDLLTAAGDLGSSESLEGFLETRGSQKSKPTLDDVLTEKRKKPTLDDILSPKPKTD